MGFVSYIKSQDMFGHKIGLTLKGEDSYQTFIGGFFSILINVLILVYMLLNLITMFTPGEGDFLSTIITNIIVDDEGLIPLNQTQLLNFFAVRKQGDLGAQLKLDDNFNDHVDISFSFLTADWYKPQGKGRFTQTSFPAR